MTHPDIDLRAYTDTGYDKGRGVGWQVAWHLVQNALWRRWWFPARLRPAVLRAFGARVGADVHIREEVYVHWPWMLSVAGPAWVGRGAALISAERIDVEPNVCVSQYAVICTGSHDRTAVDFRHDNRPVRLRSGCWVCIGAVVLPGVTVEANAVVSAGAVASRDVLARSVLR